MKTVLVLGATGYVGGRLVPKLIEDGWKVRAAARDLRKLKTRSWAADPSLELVEADVLNLVSLEKACAGCFAVYYLVHSMIAVPDQYEESDRRAAQNMAWAAAQAGVERIIYLGGLGEAASNLSKHLESRMEVARILSSGTTPVTVLRAAMIIGAGSASFEMLRYLVDRLPVMITPKWVSTMNQPIAISNVIEYLAQCLKQYETAGKSFDIGGSDVITYRRLMEIYAEEAGLAKRWVLTVPVLTPRLSSYWIHLITPVPASIARPLAEGLKNPVVCRDFEIRSLIPQTLLSCQESVRLSLQNLTQSSAATHWSDAYAKDYSASSSQPGDPGWAGGTLYSDRREIKTTASNSNLWKVLTKIGGKTGWYHADWLWRLRGFMDRMVGGVGIRRGRRDPEHIQIGDALDFWRVMNCVPGRLLKLQAEMKLPGTATLSFFIHSPDISHTDCRLEQVAEFIPRGLFGILYWYLVAPLHVYVFQGMIQKIVRRAESYGQGPE